MIRTEVATDRVMTGWGSYVDLLFLASIAENARPAAREHWEAAMQMWDGKGFADAAFKGVKIRHLQARPCCDAVRQLSPRKEVPPALLGRLFSVQSESGGWITDYDADGKAIGLANFETTSLANLAVESARDTLQRRP